MCDLKKYHALQDENFKLYEENRNLYRRLIAATNKVIAEIHCRSDPESSDRDEWYVDICNVIQ